MSVYGEKLFFEIDGWKNFNGDTEIEYIQMMNSPVSPDSKTLLFPIGLSVFIFHDRPLMNIVRNEDSFTHLLFKHYHSKQAIPKITFKHLRAAGGPELERFVIFTLLNCKIANFTSGHQEGGFIGELITLEYQFSVGSKTP